MGAPAKSARVALEALNIKEKLQVTDREHVENIPKNPYLQYFLWYEGYSNEELKESNRGKLIIDASCCPADIHYPSDVYLLNKTREKAEDIIDLLCNSAK